MTLVVTVLRYSPERDTPPAFESFEVPRIEAWSLLDALAYVKDEIDPSLTYRASCRMGVCGSCGMMVDGEPRLACEVFVRDAGASLTVEPLRYFPIERDLAIDQRHFLEKLAEVKAYLIRPHAAEDAPLAVLPQRPEELLLFADQSRCINCLLCYSACPQFGLNPAFVGPGALALAHRYNQDSRDRGRGERTAALNGVDGVWACTFIGACSEVCPKRAAPAEAIQREKFAGALDWAGSMLMPRRGA